MPENGFSTEKKLQATHLIAKNYNYNRVSNKRINLKFVMFSWGGGFIYKKLKDGFCQVWLKEI